MINDTNTFLYGDCPDHDCNCCFQVTVSLGLVFVHSVLHLTPKVNIWGFKSGECGAPSMSHCLLMIRSPNRYLSHSVGSVMGGRILLKPFIISCVAPASAQCCTKLDIALCSHGQTVRFHPRARIDRCLEMTTHDVLMFLLNIA